MSIYDALELDPVPFKPDEPGATLEIRVTDVRGLTTREGKKGALVVGYDAERREWEWVAWNRRAKAELARERPLLGDLLRIIYDGRDDQATNPALAARLFRLKVIERQTLLNNHPAERSIKPVPPARVTDGAPNTLDANDPGPLADTSADTRDEEVA